MLGSGDAFSPLSLLRRHHTHGRAVEDSPTNLETRYSTALYQAGRSDSPPLRKAKPRKICLMVEPTPFTHVSGYANRFKEMLKFLSKAGDEVDILTVDSKTPKKDLPTEAFGYPIRHTQGFTFPLYNQISLTFDLPEMKGAQILEHMKPDLIHVTSP
jgi:hypothetical protein